jgi:glyoxylase-like metal-dependent hydrolase (beta-lactamase superfamily II)
MLIEQVASDLWRLAPWSRDFLNLYVAGDVLIDSGGRLAERRVLAALTGRAIRAHALTHAHFDHQGCSHAVCERFGIPLWCGAGDREAVESGDLTRVLPSPHSLVVRLVPRLGGPAHPVARTLAEGDEVGGFTVLEVPGHTPGALAYWRARDRALILGDVLFHRNPLTWRFGLAEPFVSATFDRAANQAAIRRLAALEPAVVCFGHGPPLRDPEELRAFAATLYSRTPATSKRRNTRAPDLRRP